MHLKLQQLNTTLKKRGLINLKLQQRILHSIKRSNAS